MPDNSREILDAACIAADCVPEKLAEKIKEMRRALEDIEAATRDGLRVVTMDRDRARESLRQLGAMMHEWIEQATTENHTAVRTILRESRRRP